MSPKEEVEMDASSSSLDEPLVVCRARRLGPHCPFGNASDIEFALRPGGCVCLTGASGRGKTTLAMAVAGLLPRRLQKHVLPRRLHLQVDCEWNPALPTSERAGVLLQQTTLVDELTVAANLALALQQRRYQQHQMSNNDMDQNAEIARLLTLVGLSPTRDGPKRPHQLSGGMARRASLALQLAQHKHVVVLDEPFTGLDEDAAESVAAALVTLRTHHQTALLLISHQPHLVQRVMDSNKTKDNVTIHLQEPVLEEKENKNDNVDDNQINERNPPWHIHGVSWRHRFTDRLYEYFCYSVPLIALAFVAAGLALAMLTADVLQRLDVTDPVLNLVDTEVRPLIQLITGEAPSSFTMWGVRMKVKSMLMATVPPAKATLYAVGMTRLLVLELGPLLTALLLCGRLGGSYAGRVATLGATQQEALLQTLGVPVIAWTLGPSLAATSLAAPAVTLVGTFVGLACAAWMGHTYGLVSLADFYRHAVDSCFPVVRLRWVASLVKSWEMTRSVAECVVTEENVAVEGEVAAMMGSCGTIAESTTTGWSDLDWDFRPTFSDSYLDAAIEVVTHPIVYHTVKALVLGWGIILVADVCVRWQRPLTPRLVPLIITAAVVLDGLYVLLADWGFSQLWLRRHPSTETEWNFTNRQKPV